MAFRDLIPWSRQENRLPVPVGVERNRDNDTHPLLSLHRGMNRLFDDAFRGFGVPAFAGFDRAAGWPHVELGETDKEIRVTAELPGLDEKDVEITVEDGVLTLRGEKRSEVEDRDRGYSERSYGRFERRIGLPQSVDRDKANATFKNGVLTVTLPKTEAANENVRRIPVNGKAA
ncbi:MULTISPECIES: Hsp20/alpha crystallin family protein [Sphingomonadaceae]|uniref:Hsp20/alpha crystallin family protein n=1 Tax=Sphingomonadales TaxID=204457 RepID=UPI0007702241|nr:Hsp20/alpha crystallin family protein [Sphingobium sp. TKS]AMK22891.1 small heat shock protein [Sphingobium sp. TKS]MCF8706636.1 Hsp20/alpha crystallin family protein [Rhizorhapis sp. SPR117]